ncbi:MAG TPA: hypothetical protein VLH37_08940 [Bacteroidales bacterium]|nr:hypothetical protein [Bacteroidales bacterium]
MKYFRFLIMIVLLAGLASCRPTDTSNQNLELTDFPRASNILSPGLGWIGLIENGLVHLYYFTREMRWERDNVAAFEIPQESEGLVGMGLGSIGVLQNGVISIYVQDLNGEWERAPHYDFRVPEDIDRFFTIIQEWELSIIGLEIDGKLEFYYYDAETGDWTRDETATFVLPKGIDHYFSLGNMTIVISDKNQLGVYYLNPDSQWQFAKDHVLDVPRENRGIIPFEPGIFALLMPEDKTFRLDFYKLDTQANKWITDEGMAFRLP